VWGRPGAFWGAFVGGAGGGGPPPPPPTAAAAEALPPSKSGATDPERAELERILVDSGGVVATAAAMLGVSRQALYRRMDRLGVELERRPKG
jgi:transcriptional regulator with GAF, ATPase, and Fis domain